MVTFGAFWSNLGGHGEVHALGGARAGLCEMRGLQLHPLRERQRAYTLAQHRFWAKMSIFGLFLARTKLICDFELLGPRNSDSTLKITSSKHLPGLPRN